MRLLRATHEKSIPATDEFVYCPQRTPVQPKRLHECPCPKRHDGARPQKGWLPHIARRRTVASLPLASRIRIHWPWTFSENIQHPPGLFSRVAETDDRPDSRSRSGGGEMHRGRTGGLGRILLRPHISRRRG